MSFFQNRIDKCNYKHSKDTLHSKNKMATSLRTYKNPRNKQNLFYPLKKSGKRMSLITSGFCEGSISLEAAFAFPIYFFFLINLMSAILIIGFQSNLESAMCQTAKEMAMWGYIYEKADISLPGIALSEGYAKSQVIKQMGRNYVEKAPIRGGIYALSFLESKIMKEEMIDLKVNYGMKAAVEIVPFPDIPSVSRCRVRAWTGYDNTRGSKGQTTEEVYVYITESGTVYHTTRNCTHLNLSVKSESYEEVKELRNQNGGKYYPCESCGSGMQENVVYITNKGDRFHFYLGCSGLKRSIQEIPLSQAAGKSACKRCGGNG